MFDVFKKDWEALRKSEPGHRFQDRYHRRHQKSGGRSKFIKPLIVGTGLVVIGIGILLLVFPGPGWVTITLGLAIIAGESKILAQVLDILEMILRKLIGKQRKQS